MKQTISILVPAAGCGSRAGTAGNKILAPLHGKPLLWWTLRALTAPDAFPANVKPNQLILAARSDEFSLIQPILDDLCSSSPDFGFTSHGFTSHGFTSHGVTSHGVTSALVEGGATRQESVFNAARAARGDLLLVHDAARPLVSAALIRRVIEAARECGAALAALPCPDTVKRATPDGNVEETLDRSTLWLAQTPQIFQRELLISANSQAVADNYSGTDCASLVERLPGQRVNLVRGEAHNFKVTYPDDLERAAEIIKFKAVEPDSVP